MNHWFIEAGVNETCISWLRKVEVKILDGIVPQFWGRNHDGGEAGLAGLDAGHVEVDLFITAPNITASAAIISPARALVTRYGHTVMRAGEGGAGVTRHHPARLSAPLHWRPVTTDSEGGWVETRFLRLQSPVHCWRLELSWVGGKRVITIIVRLNFGMMIVTISEVFMILIVITVVGGGVA